MSVCANIAIKLAREMFNRKNLSDQDKPCVCAKHTTYNDNNTYIN